MADRDDDDSLPYIAAAVLSPTASTSRAGNSVVRIQRNVAEKQRRDKLNGYITELASIVPMVSMSTKRLDKTSILRLSAAHLRICKSSLGGNRKAKKVLKWCPSFLTNDQVREILESVDGFLIITTPTGKILFTSRSVERYLGHQDIDMIGHSVFMFIHPQDSDSVKDELEKLLLASLDNEPSGRCSFRCRMREKSQPRSEVITYQHVHFVGGLTPADEDIGDGKSVVSHMFKAFVKVVDASPYNQLSLEEATADEYVTRHSLDGTIIFADHRLATITGHMPHEVVGLSAYEYIHSEDTSIALFAHHLMFSNDKGTGMIVYRLRTRDDRFVYLKSVGCLQYDQSTSQVDHFVCVNQHLNESEGDAQMKYFIDRFIPHIKGSSTAALFESVKALQLSSSKPKVEKSKSDPPSESSTRPSDLFKSRNLEGNDLTCKELQRNQRILDQSEIVNPVSNFNCSNNNSPSSHEVGNQHILDQSQIEIPVSNFKGSDIKHTASHEVGPHCNVQDGKMEICSTNSACSGQYFSDYLHNTTSGNIAPQHVLAVKRSSLSQNDAVSTQTKIVLPPLVSESPHIIGGGQNCVLDKSELNMGSNVSLMPTDVQFASLSNDGRRASFPKEAQLQNLELLRAMNKQGNITVGVSGNDIDFVCGNLENHIEYDLDCVGSIDGYHSHLVNSNKNSPVFTANSFDLGLKGGANGQLINGVTYHITNQPDMNHSPFMNHNIGPSNAHLKLSRGPEEQKAHGNVIRQGPTYTKVTTETALDTFGEVSGQLKDSLSFEHDLSSLLSSTLPQEDSNSSLPSANLPYQSSLTSDVFCPTEYESSLAEDYLFQKDDN